MIEKNVLLVNSSLTVKLFEATSVWIDLTVTKMAANARYIMITIQK
jgi:hypothetical protein